MSDVWEKIRNNKVRVMAAVTAAFAIVAYYWKDFPTELWLGFAAAILGVGEAVRASVTPNERVDAKVSHEKVKSFDKGMEVGFGEGQQKATNELYDKQFNPAPGVITVNLGNDTEFSAERLADMATEFRSWYSRSAVGLPETEEWKTERAKFLEESKK